MNPNKDIVNYTNYRQFLKHYYESRKKETPRFSYNFIAQRGGLSSASFIRMVINGKKNVTKESVIKIAKALKLNKKASEYFEDIVFFTQAKDLETKEYFLKRIDKYRKKNNPKLLRSKEYDYLNEWFHAVIREVVELPGFKEEPKEIAKKFLFHVSSSDIQDSLNFLLENGFLARNRYGKIVKKEKTLSTIDIPENEDLIIIAKKYHLKMIELAKKSLSIVPKGKRSINNTTLSLSKQSFELALKRIDSLRYELLELASSDTNIDKICQLNINLFTLVENDE